MVQRHRSIDRLVSQLPRSQRVVIDSTASERLLVTSGVPQGSHVGPLLLTQFINDLPDTTLHQTSTASHVDDTKMHHLLWKWRTVIFSGRIWKVWTPGAMKQIWSLGLGLGLGCKVLTVTWKKTTVTHDYLLSDVNLGHVQEDIDLTISSNLRWDSHIMHIVLKASRMLFLLKRRCPLITNIKVRWTLNLSLVKSQLSYAKF